jgi:adenylate cyclase
MNIRLAELEACFEGVFPALIATTAPDGMPNVSYLSHVAMVDDAHIALTNQFFGKTTENLGADPRASVLVIDGHSCIQYTLEVALRETLVDGPQFERLAARVLASGARVGLAGVMRLRSVDIFRVDVIHAAPFIGALDRRQGLSAKASLAAVQRVIEAMALQTDVDGLIDATLAGLETELGIGNTLFMALEDGAGRLSAIGSRGYAQAGIGADVTLGEGVIGASALTGQPVRINDVSRTARMSAAVASSTADENVSRRIALPGLVDPLSQMAVAIPVNGALYGVLFAESQSRLAFSPDHEVALSIIARNAGAALSLIDRLASDDSAGAAAPPAVAWRDAPIEVVYYAYDDSVFIDGDYAIKGIAGRLLHYMLVQSLERGRQEFTNREIRLDTQLRLPEVKDNLETRLLLLRRRLDERGFPIRIERLARGRIRLQCDGDVRLVLGGAGHSTGDAGAPDA